MTIENISSFDISGRSREPGAATEQPERELVGATEGILEGKNGERKREIRRIEDTNSRQVTCLKRGSRLLKNAFSPKGNLCEFSSCSMQSTIDHYVMHEKDIDIRRPSDETMQQMECEPADLMKKIEILEDYKWKWWCENLETSSIEELHEIEGQLEQSLSKIRQKKNHIISEQIAQLKEKERILLEKNASLQEKFKEKTPQQDPDFTEVPDVNMEVLTELFIEKPGCSKTQSTP